MISVTLTANLQKYYPEATFEIDAQNLRDLLAKMDSRRSGFSSYILENSHNIRKHVNIFINGEVLANKKDLDQPFSPGSEIHIMQALSGG